MIRFRPAAFLWLLFCLGSHSSFAQATLDGPTSVAAGETFELSFSERYERDFITVVPPETPEGTYGVYVYARKSPVKFTAPEDAGLYEVRYLSNERPHATLTRYSLEVTPVTATLTGPAQIDAGAKIELAWTGPGYARDFITIVRPDAEEQTYDRYAYVRKNPVELVVPDEPGDYEARYLTAQNHYTLARHPFTVGSVAATLDAPASVSAGENFSVRFTGTGNERDFITIVVPDAPDKTYEEYRYTRKGDSVELKAPDEPGSYEIRYLTAQAFHTLASRPLEVLPTTASLSAPAQVAGGEPLLVDWEGPGHRGDYITLVKVGAEEKTFGPYAYTHTGNPVRILTPLEVGNYELRYAMGRSRRTLARAAVRVVEPATTPGELRVVATSNGTALTLPENAAVELILDASGSMLKKQDGKRRIDIAKEVLADLVRESLPSGTPFALRVFGHLEAESCRTDLEIPLGPLSPGAAVAKIAKIEAKNLAKTPIARSLELVADDLSGTKGTSLVVLVTDGEETCDGDPVTAVEELRRLGFDVEINIIGFAIDDADLKSTFRYWADLGGGQYFDAVNSAGLGQSIRTSLRAKYVLKNAQGVEVASGTVGGPKIEVPAGDYTVSIQTSQADWPVSVVGGEEVVLDVSAGN